MAGKMWVVFGFTIREAVMYVESQLMPLYKHNPTRPVVKKDGCVFFDIYNNPIEVKCVSNIRLLRGLRPDTLFVDGKIIRSMIFQEKYGDMAYMAQEVIVYEV